MLSRRTLLAALGAGGAAALLATPVLARQAFEPAAGLGLLHPADQQVLAEDIGLNGDSRANATAAADSSPALLGPDAPASIRKDLDGDDGDVFHVVLQYRCQPTDPVMLTVDEVTWPLLGPLFVDVAVDPWGSLGNIDDPETREPLQSASALCYTAIWSVAPAPDRLPDRVRARYRRSG